jgi:hypothetical protein
MRTWDGEVGLLRMMMGIRSVAAGRDSRKRRRLRLKRLVDCGKLDVRMEDDVACCDIRCAEAVRCDGVDAESETLVRWIRQGRGACWQVREGGLASARDLWESE